MGDSTVIKEQIYSLKNANKSKLLKLYQGYNDEQLQKKCYIKYFGRLWNKKSYLVILGLSSSCSHTACTKMAEELVWVLTHFQIFHSHSSEGCNTGEKQDSVTHNIYSQQGGARSTAGLALGCGKDLHGKAAA